MIGYEEDDGDRCDWQEEIETGLEDLTVVCSFRRWIESLLR